MLPEWIKEYLFQSGLILTMGYALTWYFRRDMKRQEDAIAAQNVSREALAKELRDRHDQIERDIEQRYHQHSERMRALEINRVTRADFDELRMSLMATIVHGNERVEQQVRELRTYLMDNPRKRP